MNTRRVAPVLRRKLTKNQGAPGPSLLGTGETTNLIREAALPGRPVPVRFISPASTCSYLPAPSVTILTEMSTKLAFLFPGQGSQAVGMGRDLAERFPIAAQTFAEADQALKFPLSQLCFEGPADVLDSTI